ncbi:MAG: cation diffusion facilitator family transporter [Muribaculum sp.]|nr:cation diffusion facilitator family transporter [Muribaculum sp.]
MSIREKKIYKVTLVGTAVNIVLVGLKFFAGIFGHSSAMIADAVHSLSDFVTDIIVLAFVRIAGKPRDKSHDYGHGKYETFASLIIGVLLVIAGLGLAVNGVELIIKNLRGDVLESPTMLALIVAILSIVSKEWLFRYTRNQGQVLNSSVTIANAWHHRSDAISSAGTLVGIAGAMFLGGKWRILDPIAAVVVSVFIIKSGIDIIRPSISELLESSLPESQEKEIRRLVLSIDGIQHVHNLRTRRIGNRIAVDLHAKMAGDMSLTLAHNKATAAENAIKKQYGSNTIVNIHMEPIEESSRKPK